ncbi:agmatinase [Sulfolobales archaeon HS-7]|nr:agmatinase [Sulfolobales archaeon HS-7]
MRQINAFESPRFTQISTFARLPTCNGKEKAAFIGIPFDDGVVYRPGARFGPMAIRDGSRLLRPYNPFVDSEPFDELMMCDDGDVNVVPGYIEDTMRRIEEHLSQEFVNKIPLIAGGDHSITLPVLRALHKVKGKANLIHFDSHYDFWDTYFGGKKYTHGTWLRRALEEDRVNNVYQIGIRGSLFSKEDLSDAKKLGVHVFNIRDVKYNYNKIIQELRKLNGPVYISLDIDVVDPAFAPATGTPEVGGLTSFEVMELLRSLEVNIVGMDVVEVSPPYDHSEITAMLAANLIYEVASVISRNLRP